MEKKQIIKHIMEKIQLKKEISAHFRRKYDISHRYFRRKYDISHRRSSLRISREFNNDVDVLEQLLEEIVKKRKK